MRTHLCEKARDLVAKSLSAEPLRVFFLDQVKMASHFIQDEISTAIREEVSRILGQDQLPSTSGTQLEPPSRSTSVHDRTSSSSSTDRTLSFEEFYKKHEDERQDGFKPPKKKVKKSSSTPVVAKKLKNVDIKVGASW